MNNHSRVDLHDDDGSARMSQDRSVSHASRQILLYGQRCSCNRSVVKCR